jgi:flagellar biosynthetic protein FliR
VNELAELARQLELSGVLVAGALVLARVSPLVVLAPFLGGPALPTPVRTVVALAVAAAVLPAALAAPPQQVDAGLFLLLLLKEATVGTCLGLLAAVAFHVLAMAGELVDLTRGVSQSQVMGFFAGEEQSPLASLQLQLGVVLFVLMGGHRAFLAAVAGSYDAVPLGELPLAASGLREVAMLSARLVGGAIAAALMLAAPAVVAVTATDLAMGLLGRAAPQLGTYFMALPLRAAVGLALALLALSLVAGEIVPALAQVAAVARDTAGALRPAP